MKGKRHTPEQIDRKLREADRLLAEGADVDAVCRHISVAGRILVAHGHMPPPEPGEPGMFVLGDEELLRRLVENAGFANVRMEDVPVHNDYPSVDEYVRRSSEMGGMFSKAPRKRLDQADRQAVATRGNRFAAPGYEGVDAGACAAQSGDRDSAIPRS